MKKIIVCMITLAFVVLKLTGYIGWSWVWVLSPLWIAIMLWIIFTIVVIFIAIKAEKIERQRPKRKGVLMSKLEALQEQQERLQQERKAKG